MIGQRHIVGGVPAELLRHEDAALTVWKRWLARGWVLPRFPEPDCHCADLLHRRADFCPAHPRARITHPRGTRTP